MRILHLSLAALCVGLLADPALALVPHARPNRGGGRPAPHHSPPARMPSYHARCRAPPRAPPRAPTRAPTRATASLPCAAPSHAPAYRPAPHPVAQPTPRPSRPIVRPQRPIAQPARPLAGGGRPSPNRPTVRPNRPIANPNRPTGGGVRPTPNRPIVRPDRPRPNLPGSSRPIVRPDRPRPNLPGSSTIIGGRNTSLVAGNRGSNINRGSRFESSIRDFNRPWRSYHHGWYHGGWWNWPSYPAVWAGLVGGNWLAPWANGSSFDYDNPYYAAPAYDDEDPSGYAVPPGLDYAQPIPVPTDDQVQATDNDTVTDAMSYCGSARASFKKGQYAKATAGLDRALQLLPGDRSMQEFRALTLFARAKYDEAAGVLYAVLAGGPGWDWNTMMALYPRTDVYTPQLRGMEAFVTAHPEDGKAHFLLGYHYLVLDDRDAAIAELRTAAKLTPEDQLSAQLADALSQKPKNAE